MTEVRLELSYARASACVHDGPLTSGMVGVPVRVVFGWGWDNLTPTLICYGGGKAVPMVIDANGDSELPHECLKAGTQLRIGVEGINADGTVVVPTIMADVSLVHASVADLHLEDHQPVTPDIVDQIQALAYSADSKAQSVVDRANSGEFDGEDGYTPVKGVDYFDGKDGYTPVKGVDYFDGEPGYTPRKGIDYFDGKTPVKGVDYFDGKDGYTPRKNIDYFDGEKGDPGDDYILTDNDKLVIANMAAEIIAPQIGAIAEAVKTLADIAEEVCR